MARGKQPAKISDGRDVRYLNVDITKEMKSALVKWTESNPDLWDLLEKALDSGLRCSMSFDTYNECFQASFTRLPVAGKEQITLVLVGRGGTLMQAFQALQYKYWVVLQENMEDGDIKNPRGVTDWG